MITPGSGSPVFIKLLLNQQKTSNLFINHNFLHYIHKPSPEGGLGFKKKGEGVKNHTLDIKDGCCRFSKACNFEPEMLPLNVSNLQFFTPSLT